MASVFLAAQIGAYPTDGDRWWKNFCYAMVEYMGEIGSTVPEPLLQAGWLGQVLTRYYRCPCWLYGRRLDRPHLRVLPPMLSLFYHATDVDMRSLFWGGEGDSRAQTLL